MRQVTIALWGHTREQRNTELRQDEASYNSSMGIHKGPTPHWVRISNRRIPYYLDIIKMKIIFPCKEDSTEWHP